MSVLYRQFSAIQKLNNCRNILSEVAEHSCSIFSVGHVPKATEVAKKLHAVRSHLKSKLFAHENVIVDRRPEFETKRLGELVLEENFNHPKNVTYS